MAANETHITRITRAIGTVTSIFRCHGLQVISPNADRIGGHDLLYWVGFLALLSAWFLFVYMPQCRRFERLTGRQQSLVLELDTGKKELAQLRQGIASLHNGDAMAWERAARKRLGWLEPGEVLDAEKWKQSRLALGSLPAVPRGSVNAGIVRTLPSAPMLPRPRVPQIPHAITSTSGALTRIRAPGGHFAESGALGPTFESPPSPPQAPSIPALPRRNNLTFAQRMPVVQPVNFSQRD